MDNAMVKRGIGAVVLAIIAALLLGYLLKDKSRAREDIVDMKLPGAPEITIPSLSDATSKITGSAASLVGEAKDSMSNAGSAVIDSASGAVSKVTDSTSNVVDAVTNSVSASSEAVVDKVTTSSSVASSNPGFSFRPPNKNEEQQINTDSSPNNISNNSSNANTSNETSSNNTVVASTPKPEAKPAKVFKPVIENEPKKVVKKKPIAKKVVAKKPVAKKAATTTKPATSTSSKYAIQLLATSSQSRANKLAKTMSSEGYSSFITETSNNNKILYRVRVGGHGDRSAALKAQEAMKRRYQKNFSVQNSLVVSQ